MLVARLEMEMEGTMQGLGLIGRPIKEREARAGWFAAKATTPDNDTKL